MYEEESVENQDYILQLNNADQASIQFKYPGRYVVRLHLLDMQNQPLSKVAKRFKVDSDIR